MLQKNVSNFIIQSLN